MKLQDYLIMNAKFKRMEKVVDVWAIDYALEKLKPAIDDGFEYEDIANFLLTRFDEFVQGGKLDELIKKDKKNKE
tara:strand:+ start:1890 stop:2114 length:225 start_codon:yes stop_codon:yes gene_type:complete